MVVLHAVTLVNNHVLPPDLGQECLVLDDVLVSGDQSVELARPDDGLNVPMVRQVWSLTRSWYISF